MPEFVPTKRCSDCKRDLPMTREHWRIRDGCPHGARCRKCYNLRSTARLATPEGREGRRLYRQEYQLRPGNRARLAAYSARYQSSEKGRATHAARMTRPEVVARHNAQSLARWHARQEARRETLDHLLSQQPEH